MKELITLTVCALLIVAASPVQALFGMPETMEGTIQSVSEKTLEITHEMDPKQQVVQIQVNEETQFEETADSLENLKKGDKVKVQYKEEGDEKIAISISKVMETDLTKATRK